jgi:hypothetical protein
MRYFKIVDSNNNVGIFSSDIKEEIEKYRNLAIGLGCRFYELTEERGQELQKIALKEIVIEIDYRDMEGFD